ncbi:hypothetical protein WEH80_04220 [Actinomycetes bacterium KLBMP 9759]
MSLAVLDAAAASFSPGRRVDPVFLVACALTYLVALAQFAPLRTSSSWDFADYVD